MPHLQRVPSFPKSPSDHIILTYSMIKSSLPNIHPAARRCRPHEVIIMYSSSPIDFHIICDEDAQTYLEKRLNLITRPVHNIRVRFYRIPWESMIARIEREGAITTDHSAGIPGLMKLFIHEILPPHPEPQWHNANRICSCIMLLDLARLRAMRLMDSVHYRADPQAPSARPAAFEAMFGPPSQATGHYEDVKLGDQGYWWAIISHRPEIFEHLSYDWEISSCLMDMYMTGLGDDDADEEHEVRVQVHTWETPHKDQAVLPKMLHFNCLDGTSRYYEWEGWSTPRIASQCAGSLPPAHSTATSSVLLPFD
ncbi:hypothetical protein A0H81_04684 [Grifola frondosa]|uniref:Uncharacterized protein n=1 Tax=Grifola frondosa TaxID=5627 RepID=A0A1C7MER6_GRIFR|nr:hypothetical protein A0H81_04684 [Grifola frondosa]